MSKLPILIERLLTEGNNVTYALVRVELCQDFRNMAPSELHAEVCHTLDVPDISLVGLFNSTSVARLLAETLHKHKALERDGDMVTFVEKPAPEEPKGEPG